MLRVHALNEFQDLDLIVKRLRNSICFLISQYGFMMLLRYIMYHQSSLKLLGDIIIHSAKNTYPSKQSNFLSVITLSLAFLHGES